MRNLTVIFSHLIMCSSDVKAKNVYIFQLIVGHLPNECSCIKKRLRFVWRLQFWRTRNFGRNPLSRAKNAKNNLFFSFHITSSVRDGNLRKFSNKFNSTFYFQFLVRVRTSSKVVNTDWENFHKFLWHMYDKN